ncbi:MAG: histidine kinase [Lachnospiraceae bacterium]|nr:histidine kinase [Lachnospiraceae bacterium]
MNEKIEVLVMQESERKRIADELHDTTVQDLVHLSQQLELATMYMNSDLNQTRLELVSAKKLIKKIIQDMRGTIYDLRPMALDDIGWNAALDKLKKDFKEKSDINVNFNVCNIDKLESIIRITIYRIICEACRNTYKHAKAESITVTMKRNGKSLILDIVDDGIGIGEYDETNHFGLSMIKEKVDLLSGKLSIITNERGTNINIVIPVE